MASRCGAGFVTEVSYFALRSITPECFPSLSQKTIAPLTPTFSLCCSPRFTMTAAASEFAPSLLSVTGSQGPGREQHILASRCCNILTRPALDIHMTPPDDPLAPVPRDLTAYSITIPKYPEQCCVLHLWGPNCSQRSSSKEGRQTSTCDAPPMLWPHSRRTRWSPWMARRFGMSKGTAWCVIFMTRRRSKPAIQSHSPRLQMVWPKTYHLRQNNYSFDALQTYWFWN